MSEGTAILLVDDEPGMLRYMKPPPPGKKPSSAWRRDFSPTWFCSMS